MINKTLNKLPISALVITCNEAHLLEDCLASISFCDEIVIVDLESEDSPEEIANEFGVKLFKHSRLPISELVVEIYAPKLSNDWVLLIDPDEIVSDELQKIIIENFYKLVKNKKVSDIVVPWKFYFGTVELRGTPWGINRFKPLIVNKKYVDFIGLVHNGLKRELGTTQLTIGNQPDQAFLKHRWMQSWNQLFEKHLRYLDGEGEARFTSQGRAKFYNLFFTPPKEFVYAFFYKKGYRDGILGLNLSLFWTWYQSSAYYRYLKYSFIANKDSAKI